MSFKTHKLNEKGLKEVNGFKKALCAMKELVETMSGGESRDLSLAMTKLEEFSFWATKSIASRHGNYEEIITYD